MRQITVDFSSPTSPLFAGYIGEHNATELIAIKPEDLSGEMYSLAFMINGEVIHSKFFSADEEIRVLLWKQLTQENILYVQLEAYKENGAYLGKSAKVKLLLSNSVCGRDTVADTDNPDVYAEIAQNTLFRESLKDNTETLKKLSTSEDGKSLLFDGNEINSGVDVPTKTSELENDSGFITKADIPTDESYEPVGQTPLTLENGGNIKLVADGETSYSIVSPTVWNFDDAELTLSNVEMSTDEGYYKFTVNNEDTHHWKHNISFVVSGLEVGRKYKFIFDVSNRTYDTASKTGYGAFQIYSGSAVAGTPITTHYPKNGNICEFTAPNTSIAIRWIVPIGSAPYLGWVLNFNKLYLNYAEMSDKLVEKYNNSGTFTDIEAFKSIPSGVYITTDPTASVYRKTPTDKTLTQSDVPADAEATGKEISVLKSCLPLYGKTIVNFGDSIFANGYPSNDISTFLSEKTGATVYNCGFGGCTMFDNNPFSMCNLATAIATKDFTAAENDLTTANRPEYFATNIEKLKTIDFSKVDIVTISYGTNDFMADANIENGENAYDKATICGALRHSVETLLTAYPNLRIFVLSLTYRFYIDENNEFVEDSNTYTNGNGDTIPDVNAKLAETAKEYNLPFIDNYNIGIGKFNRYQYFPTTDGTHQQVAGRKLIAEHLAGALTVATNLGGGADGNDYVLADADKAEIAEMVKPKLHILEAVVDYGTTGVHTYDPMSLTVEADIPTNARAKRVEIPDVVNGTDEFIALEDMVSKDPSYGFDAPYFIMYPKNKTGAMSKVAANVVFAFQTPNSFYEMATNYAYDGKIIKIYYEIEE